MISFLSRTIDFFFFFLSLWIYLWLAETIQQPISQTTWLKVTHARSMAHSGDTPTPKAPMTRLRALQRSASAEEEPEPSFGQHDPYDEEYGGDVGSEDEDEEWGDLEEAEVGLDQIHNDWQERMERKKGKNKG